MAGLIRAFAWQDTPLGPLDGWPQSLKTAVDTILGMPSPANIFWGPQHVEIYNDSFVEIARERHPRLLGQPAAIGWADVFDEVRVLLSAALAGKATQLRDYMSLVDGPAGPDPRVFDAEWSPLRDESGEVAGVLQTLVEATQRHRAETALRESEERHAFLLSLTDRLRNVADALDATTITAERFGRRLGLAVAHFLLFDADEDSYTLGGAYSDGRLEAGLQRSGRLSDHGPGWGPQVRAGEAIFSDDHETRSTADADASRSFGVRSGSAVPLIRDGRMVAIFSTAHPEPRRWTESEKQLQREVAERTWAAVERVRAEAALRESKERLHVALAAAELGTFVWHVAQDRTEEDARARVHFGLPPDGTVSLAEALATTFHPDDGPRYAAAVARAIDPAGPGTLHEEFRIRRSDGQERWMSVSAITAFEGMPRAAVRLTGALADVTDRKRTEAALRESEERQTYLLRLSDALRPLADISKITEAATRLLGEWLGASRVYYAEWPHGADYGEVARDYAAPGVASLAGRYPIDAFRSAYDKISAGRTWIVQDNATADVSAAERRHHAEAGVIAWVDVPLIKRGLVEAALCVVQDRPREWTAREIALVEETAERVWAAVERGRAEAALRESEERFRQFAAASSGALWIRTADTLDMEYVSPSITTIYGVEMETFLGDMKLWAALIVPEDRDIALANIERARQGESVVHEFRIQRPSDKAFRWIRNIEFPLRDEQGRIHRIGGIAEDVTEAKLAVEHQGVLLAELQHRVRNIMAILRSITVRTAESAADVPEYATRMSGRLLALARVQALLTRAANAKVGIRSIVHDEVSVQAHHEGQYVLDGPDVELSPKAAEVLTLAVHELATNALKYGALSVPNGQVRVTWETVEKHGVPWLVFDWTEEGAPQSPEPATARSRRQGFGSELIEGRVPYELKGRGRLVIERGGARCHLEFPLKGGASVLETGAPQRASVFGGALDMTGEADLGGSRVLVVEDDYYLATDAARALRGAGAEVMGPSSTEEAARAELLEQRPHAVLLDINLGAGPSFKLAEKLLDDGIPFVFVTGYDQEVIPPEFAEVERLEKPVPLRQIVSAIAKLVRST